MALGDDLKLASDTLCAPGEKTLSPREPTVYDPPELLTSGPSPAGDVWSLGVTLVEALTQQTSPGHAMRQADPAIPETIPAPFLDIARQCLRMDPERRWTVSEVAARLLPVQVVPPKSAMRPGYVVASLIVLLLGAVLVGPRLIHRSPEATRSPSQPAEGVKTDVPHSASSPPTSSSNSTPPNSKPPTDLRTPKKSEPSNASKIPGEVASQVLPTVSQRSLNTITGKVRVGVRLSVDATGQVVNASLPSPGPSKYFASIAQEASRRWKFTPPQVNGEATRSEWMLNFAFARKGVEVQPKQLSP
jgi:TonB family protein